MEKGPHKHLDLTEVRFWGCNQNFYKTFGGSFQKKQKGDSFKSHQNIRVFLPKNSIIYVHHYILSKYI